MSHLPVRVVTLASKKQALCTLISVMHQAHLLNYSKALRLTTTTIEALYAPYPTCGTPTF